MFITLETDYAVRIVAELCKNPEKFDAKTIAEKSCVTLRFALKILRKLVASGIVKSYKGTQGGYEINMPAKDITLKMVAESIEGTYFFSRCLSPEGICNRGASGNCNFQKAFREITDTVQDMLDKYNFADLISDTEDNKEDVPSQTSEV
jgi:Rrf2 family protein